MGRMTGTSDTAMTFGTLPGSGLRLSRLIQGTAMIGAGDESADFRLLDAAFDAGFTTFDTAHNYNDGGSERSLGAWLEARGVRDRIVILGKGAHHDTERRRVTPHDIVDDLLDSLARLRVEHIDLYVLHRDDPAVPVGPIVEVLDEQHRAGRIGAYGGSNWSHHRIAAANAYAEEHGLTPFTVSSPNLSLARQVQAPWEDCISIGGDEEAIAWYRDHDVAVLPWSSLAGGFFSGRFRRDNLDTFGSYGDRLCVTSYCTEENFGRLDRAERLAAARGVTLAQIALAWVLHQPFEVFPLVGARNRAELDANVAALSIELSDDEVRWLEQGG